VSSAAKSWRAASFSAEILGVMLATWAALISVPLALGQIGISWDALNHHIYLGWVADRPRFERDFLAASYQSYQFPYLYWPVYKLSASGVSGAWAGVVLATLEWLAVPALWLIARACIPGRSWFDTWMRGISVVLGLSSGLVLSLLDTTANDLLAAVPLVWAVAFAMAPLDVENSHLSTRRAVLLSGLFAGVAIACKLSNGPLAVLLPVFWICCGASFNQKLANALLGCVAVVAGFVLAYGYWGWQLWQHFGNPVYPFYDEIFERVRNWAGWQR